MAFRFKQNGDARLKISRTFCVILFGASALFISACRTAPAKPRYIQRIEPIAVSSATTVSSASTPVPMLQNIPKPAMNISTVAVAESSPSIPSQVGTKKQSKAVVTEAVVTMPVATSMNSIPSPTSNDSSWRSVINGVFFPGEKFRYVIKWGLVIGGYSTLEVSGIDSVNGRPAFHLVSEAQSSGMVDAFYQVTDRNDAWLDTQSLSSVRYEKRIREGKYQLDETVILDQPNHHFYVHSYRLDQKEKEEKQGKMPANLLDIFGSLYYLRTLPMEIGKSYSFDVISGTKIYPMVVKIEGRETVKVGAGKFDCFKVEPMLREPGIFISKGKKLVVWITADNRRMPVLMRSEVFIGHVSAELVSYEMPQQP